MKLSLLTEGLESFDDKDGFDDQEKFSYGVRKVISYLNNNFIYPRNLTDDKLQEICSEFIYYPEVYGYEDGSWEITSGEESATIYYRNMFGSGWEMA